MDCLFGLLHTCGLAHYCTVSALDDSSSLLLITYQAPR